MVYHLAMYSEQRNKLSEVTLATVILKVPQPRPQRDTSSLPIADGDKTEGFT
jgi:hypothetical protein